MKDAACPDLPELARVLASMETMTVKNCIDELGAQDINDLNDFLKENKLCEQVVPKLVKFFHKDPGPREGGGTYCVSIGLYSL